jgi:hypothetical protein
MRGCVNHMNVSEHVSVCVRAHTVLRGPDVRRAVPGDGPHHVHRGYGYGRGVVLSGGGRELLLPSNLQPIREQLGISADMQLVSEFTQFKTHFHDPENN